MEEPKQH